jgi:DNA-binding response OmpR family regulator
METILVIEDKESMAEMLRETLETEGYRVISARDGMEGINYLKEGKIDLVLTDLNCLKKAAWIFLRHRRKRTISSQL